MCFTNRGYAFDVTITWAHIQLYIFHAQQLLSRANGGLLMVGSIFLARTKLKTIDLSWVIAIKRTFSNTANIFQPSNMAATLYTMTVNVCFTELMFSDALPCITSIQCLISTCSAKWQLPCYLYRMLFTKITNYNRNMCYQCLWTLYSDK